MEGNTSPMARLWKEIPVPWPGYGGKYQSHGQAMEGNMSQDDKDL